MHERAVVDMLIGRNLEKNILLKHRDDIGERKQRIGPG